MHELLSGKALLIDMDGVLYRGDEAIEGACAFIEQLRMSGNPFVYLTNNSRFTIEAFVKKLAEVGIRAEAKDVLTSAEATACVLCDECCQEKPVYVIGGPGMHAALEDAGWKIRYDEAQPDAGGLLDWQGIAAVVVAEGYEMTPGRMEQAINLVAKGVPLYATNPDVNIPGPDDSILLGCGCLYCGIERATAREAIVIGKPEPALFYQAIAKLDATVDNAVMIGDRLDTDIKGAKEIGMQAILVLTGPHTREEGENYDPQPDIIVDSIANLL